MTLTSRFRWLTHASLALTVAILFTLVSTTMAFASGGVSLLQLSSDPYTNNTSQHQTEVEPDSFSFGSTIVSAFQVGRFYNGGSDNIGWATSTNNGKAWTNGFLPGTTVYSTPAGSFTRISDPAVAYDAAHHSWMISSLAIEQSIAPAVVVSLSANGGTAWGSPVTVVNAPAKTNLDKDWIACDDTATSTFYGHCYVEWDVSSSSELIEMSTSTDGGQTWSAPQTTADQARGIGGQPLVQPNGTVIVPISNPAFTQLLSFVSTNGGASWSSTVMAAPTPFYTEEAKIRTGFQSAAMDGSGKVYVVWSGCSFESGCTANDLIISTTTDGLAWSTPQLIPIDPVRSGIDHIIPSLALDPSTSGSTAHLALTYYYFPDASCSTSTCQLNVAYVASTNGGNTWSAKTQLAGPMMLVWLANTTSGYMVGDYVSTSIVGGHAFPIIAVATAPLKQTLNEAIYTVAGGLVV